MKKNYKIKRYADSSVYLFVWRNYVLPIENAVVALLIKIVLSGAMYLSVLGVTIMVKKVFTHLKRLEL